MISSRYTLMERNTENVHLNIGKRLLANGNSGEVSESAKDAAARRQRKKEHTSPLGGTIDTAAVLRVFLKAHMKIGVVGHGVVGSAVARHFSADHRPEVTIYDKFQPPYNHPGRKTAVNACDLVFVAVPTPIGQDGVSCDVSAVEECVSWITVPICIRSTIPPGTVDRLSAATGKSIVFSPEYLGEQLGHPWRNEGDSGFLIVGGSPDVCELVLSAYRSIPELELKYYCTNARTAELCKYMENCYLATKVAFVNQFFDIAHALNIDFDELRLLWLADPRIGSSHSTVTAVRGFRGRCLPKDISALVAVMKPFGGAPLLEAVMEYNARLCEFAAGAADSSALAAGS
jgi:UDPglucose 6-dehydrogenase